MRIFFIFRGGRVHVADTVYFYPLVILDLKMGEISLTEWHLPLHSKSPWRWRYYN